MNGFAKRFFKIESGETAKVIHFGLLGAFLQAGLSVGITTADALFLSTVGPSKLPLIYLLTPVIMLGYTPIYAYFISQKGMRWVLDVTLMILAGGGVVFFLATSWASGFAGGLVYYLAKLYTALWYIALYSLFWNFADNFFDIQDGKRLFAFFSGGLALGGIVGGALVTELADYVKAEHLFLLWSVIAAITIPLCRRIQAKWNPVDGDDFAENSRASVWRETRQTVSVIKGSRYALLLIGLFFTNLLATTLCEYQYMGIFSTGRSSEDLARLFGSLYAGVNVLNLTVNFFVFNRLVLRIGVRNTALIQPVVYLAAFFLYRFDYGMAAGVMGFFAYQGFLTSIDYNNSNFLFNALPGQWKQRMRTLIEGLCEPCAAAAVGVFLLVAQNHLSFAQVSEAGLGVVVLFSLAAVAVRKEYYVAMVRNLKGDWLDFSRPVGPILSKLSSEEINVLEARAKAGSVDQVLQSCELLLHKEPRIALEVFLSALERFPMDEQDRFLPLLRQALRSKNETVMERLAHWLADLPVPLSCRFVEVLGNQGLLSPNQMAPFIASERSEARAAAAAGLWRSWNLAEHIQAGENIQRLLSGSEADQVLGIRLLGLTGLSHFGFALVPFLENGPPGLRAAALSAICDLAGPDSGRLVPFLLDAIPKASSEERMLAMEALMRIGESASILPLLSMADGFSPQEARQAVRLVTSIGLQSVPLLIRLFQDGNENCSVRLLAGRALGILAFPQFDAHFRVLVNRAVSQAYFFVHIRAILAGNRIDSLGLTVLTRLYGDLVREIVEFVLGCLSVAGSLPDYEMVIMALDSHNPRERANALETIEQGCEHELFKNLLPLMDGRPLEAKAEFGRRHIFPEPPSFEEMIERGLRSKFRLECAAAILVYWDSDPGRSVGELRRRTKDVDPSVIEPILRMLLTKGLPATGAITPEFTTVETVATLARAPFFERFKIRELNHISARTEAVHAPEGAVLYNFEDSAEVFYLIARGRVAWFAPGTERLLEAGEVFGHRVLFGRIRRQDRAVSLGATLLRIPREAVIGAAGIFPNLAVQLFSKRLEEEP